MGSLLLAAALAGLGQEKCTGSSNLSLVVPTRRLRILAAHLNGTGVIGDAIATNAPSAAATAAMDGKARRSPHLIVVMADDMGFNGKHNLVYQLALKYAMPADLGGFHAHETKAPHSPFLAGLMKEGIRMKRFYCEPICSPTRAGESQ